MSLVLYLGLQKIFFSYLRVLSKLKELEPEEILSLKRKEIENFGIREKEAELIVSKEVLKIGEEELKKAEKAKISVVPIFSFDYPALLKEINDPPLVFYLKGKIETLTKPSVSIVGTRNCTPYGRVVAESLSSELSKSGLVIVSGLARGIDSIAHSTALEYGETIAVLGSGLDKIYPRENGKLALRIEEKGAIISEFPLGTRAFPYNFPIRNRIISGLSYITVVVEASDKSGSLITAKWALEQGRDVLSVPGAITSPTSRGTNLLIKLGAKPVLGWEDVMEELPAFIKEKLESKIHEEKPKLSSEEEKILSFIPVDSDVSIDELALASGFPVQELFSILFQLQLKDLIIENTGKSYQKRLR